MAIQGKSLLRRNVNRARRSKYIFCVTMAAIPVLQFILMYLGARIQSFTLAFQHYENSASGIGYDITFAGFDNFVKAFERLKLQSSSLENSMILFGCTTFIGTTLALVFSFYIYKKYAGSGIFKTVLFMPQVISSLIFAVIFKYLVNEGYSYIMEEISGEKVTGVLNDPDTRFGMLIFFNIWISFGVNVLLYSGAMSGINESVVESARLDGVNIVQEFIHITLPLIYPTIVTFIVINISGIFTNTYAVLDLFGIHSVEVNNMGSWLYTKAEAAQKGRIWAEEYRQVNYSVLSAMGFILTAIVFPIVLIVKRLLEKYGPRGD